MFKTQLIAQTYRVDLTVEQFGKIQTAYLAATTNLDMDISSHLCEINGGEGIHDIAIEEYDAGVVIYIELDGDQMSTSLQWVLDKLQQYLNSAP